MKSIYFLIIFSYECQTKIKIGINIFNFFFELKHFRSEIIYRNRDSFENLNPHDEELF